MKSIELGYWLPRIIVIAFALSLLCPAPEFIQGLDRGGYIVWMARLIWVISVPAFFGIVLVMVAAFWKNGSRNKKDSSED